MTPIYKASQIKDIDAYTIKNMPISSINLMERAVMELCLAVQYHNKDKFVIFAGPGNNGGDALGVARHLYEKGCSVSAFLYKCGHNLSADCLINKDRLSKTCPDVLTVVEDYYFPDIQDSAIIIDGLFGNGLNRPLEGVYADVVKRINLLSNTVIAIDMPSGLMAENNGMNMKEHIVRADYTYTFQYPKLSFFFAENQSFVGEWKVLNIGLLNSEDTITDVFYIDNQDVIHSLKKKQKYAHKGSEGHAMILAGQVGMAGAALLATKACLRAGVGKVTVATQEQNRIILQLGIPEAILLMNEKNDYLKTLMRYQAIGVGPGIGTADKVADKLEQILNYYRQPMVIDADAINIMAVKRNLIGCIPAMSILTPHKLELKRLVNASSDDYDELIKAKTFAKENQVIMVLKGAFSKIILPNGTIFVNPTGNPGMATAGSGDVLTGIITAMLAQGYTPEKAAIIGVYLHGLAGDFAAENVGQTSLIASDIIEYLPQAFISLFKRKSMSYV